MEPVGVGGTARGILNSLKRRGQATVVNLSDEFGLSGMAVRHHLFTLRAKGLVESTHERRGVGRPTEVFKLTELGDELFPRHYDKFATDILTSIQAIEGKEKTDAIFDQRQRRQLEEHSKRLAGLPLNEKVLALARILTEDGFQADSEQRGDEFIITEHNCALNKVAQHFNKVCECELNLIAELLNADVTRKEHIVGGDHCCSYVIRPK